MYLAWDKNWDRFVILILLAPLLQAVQVAGFICCTYTILWLAGHKNTLVGRGWRGVRGSLGRVILSTDFYVVLGTVLIYLLPFAHKLHIEAVYHSGQLQEGMVCNIFFLDFKYYNTYSRINISINQREHSPKKLAAWLSRCCWDMEQYS